MRSGGQRWLLSAGLGWALFCLLLWSGGHAPSRVLLPLPRESYYLFQAAVVIPVLFGSWWLASRVAHRVATALGGSGTLPDCAEGLALSLAPPIALLVVVPDVVVYLAWGFGALGRLIRVTAPLSGVLTLVLATRAMRRAHALGSGRAFVAGAAGVVTQALLGGAVLR
jgi:hypothetical protein